MTGNIAVLLMAMAIASGEADTNMKMAVQDHEIVVRKENQETTEELFETNNQPRRIRCTCYIDYGYTKSGEFVRDGIAAMNDDLLGKTAILYDENMNYIGIWEIKDTGGHKDLKNGTRIDIYREDMESAMEWVIRYGDYVYVQLIDAVG